MVDKCYICGTNMEEKTVTTAAGWGKYKFIITDVKAYVCPKCGEIVFSAKEIHKLQELGKKYKEMLEYKK